MNNLSYINIKRKSCFLLLIFLPLFLMSSFRNGLGTDYYHYADMFKNPDMVIGEPLFKILFLFLPRLISDNEIIFFLITSFIVNLFFLRSIFKYSSFISLSILIYITQYYFTSYNIVRQFLAMGLFLYYGIKYLNENKLISYYILVVILAQIHFSIYFMLFFPILGCREYRTLTYWFIWSISFIFFFLLSKQIINIWRIFDYISYLSFISDKFSLTGKAISSFFLGLFKSNNQLLLKNALCVMLLFRAKYFRKTGNIYWFNLFLFGVLINNFFVNLSLYAVRLAYVGDIALLMLVPLFIKSFKDKYIRIMLVMLFVLYFSSMFYYKFILMGESEVFNKGVSW